MTPPRHLPSGLGRRASKNTSISAGFVGTGIIALAHVVGVQTAAGQVLLYAAPTLCVIAGAMFAQLHQEAGRYGERRQIRRIRRTFERQLGNTHTSDDHKAKIRALLEDLDQAEAEAELARLNLIHSPIRST